MGAFRSLINHRHLLWSVVAHGVKGRTSGHALGAVWLILYPLLFLAMYSVVFVHILRVKIPDLETSDYVLSIFCGLVPFLAFSEAFAAGTQSIVANRGLLKNTMFPIELVVAKDVIVGHISMGLGMLLVLGSVAIAREAYWTQLAVPFIFFVQIVMVLGLVWISATLAVFFRDIQLAIPIIVLFLMLVSPIAYRSDMVPDGMRGLVILNPLAWLMDMYRATMMDGVLPIKTLFFLSLFSFSIFFVGYFLVSKLKPLFADYV